MIQNETNSTYNQLCLEADAIEAKIKSDLADPTDFLQLKALANEFAATGHVRGSFFCLKQQVKFKFNQYRKKRSLPEGVIILEEAHELAIDLINNSESKKSVAPAFYKALLKVKIELANAKRSLGFCDEALDLELCAKRIYDKAQKLFPTYQNFPTQLLNQQ